MEIHTLGVVGAGQMGAGIAQVAATNGVRVIMNDMNDEFVKKGRQRIVDNLNRLVEKRRFSETERRQTLDRISVSSDLRHMATADFVVEAASENEQIKFKLFQELDDICREHVILASNTSSIPIGRIAAATRRPDRVIGMHFMNPVPMMQLVEIIRGLATSDETYDTTRLLTEKLAKTPVLANDFPGFIANRILLPMINEAIYCVYHGVGDCEAIDTVMKLGMNHPMGPLALADLIGLDTCLAIMETLHKGLGDPKYRPCPLLRQYVEAGWLGRKSGRGFYTYN
ncbi:MAG: 3-hydroxybutyryl-CoA dehydrogenase [Desulfoprunum sp.]|jgi:3-hydroxybutyryl-CoA dehydrogenase|uniref:3-hydroxybutyryl-CoA dehydrogenase n=1 Tax=Desulfoprunum sp. TaxID=2020866 RepID=UPI00052BA3D9|nr:3-hydroxybutyryl-CoA dehydrogenase [Desulfobulbus sp. Tol-SR]